MNDDMSSVPMYLKKTVSLKSELQILPPYRLSLRCHFTSILSSKTEQHLKTPLLLWCDYFVFCFPGADFNADKKGMHVSFIYFIQLYSIITG